MTHTLRNSSSKGLTPFIINNNLKLTNYFNVVIYTILKNYHSTHQAKYITCLLYHQDVSVTTAYLLGDSLNTLIKIYSVLTFKIH